MTEKPDAWMPIYIGDYLRDTGHLNAAQHGAYLLLLMQQWTAGVLPSDLEALRRIARMDRDEFTHAWSILQAFFKECPGGCYQPRLARERDAAFARRSKFAKRAKAAAEARWNKENGGIQAPDAPIPDACGNATSIAYGDARAVHEECPPPSPSPMESHPRKEGDDSHTGPAAIAAQPALALETSYGPDPIDEAVRLWNEAAKRAGRPVAQKITDARRRKIRARLKDVGGVEGWKVAIEKVDASAFCNGAGPRGWVMNLDDLVQEQTFVRLLEGGYDDRRPGAAGAASSALSEVLRRRVEETAPDSEYP